jgi:hypothetical protein
LQSVIYIVQRHFQSISNDHFFPQANALFVLYTEATLGVKCDAVGNAMAEQEAVQHANKAPNQIESANKKNAGRFGRFYSNPYHNNPEVPEHYQGVVAKVPFDTTPSAIDVEKKIKNEVLTAMYSRERKQAATEKLEPITSAGAASHTLRQGERKKDKA